MVERFFWSGTRRGGNLLKEVPSTTADDKHSLLCLRRQRRLCRRAGRHGCRSFAPGQAPSYSRCRSCFLCQQPEARREPLERGSLLALLPPELFNGGGEVIVQYGIDRKPAVQPLRLFIGLWRHAACVLLPPFPYPPPKGFPKGRGPFGGGAGAAPPECNRTTDALHASLGRVSNGSWIFWRGCGGSAPGSPQACYMK